jgi:hypothetical protein
MAFRIARIVGGLILAYVNSIGTQETFLGLFLPPTTAGKAGWDLAKVLIYCLSGWLVYRGIRPVANRPVAPKP